MDDYYMNKIDILHNNMLYSFNTSSIELESEKAFEWKNALEYKKSTDSLQFKINKNKIYIKINYKNNELHFFIKRSINYLFNKHLNIFFHALKYSEKRYNGIIGFVGKQQITLNYIIQKNNTAKMKINKIQVNVSEKKSVIKNCWLIDFKYLIYPFNKNYFVE